MSTTTDSTALSPATQQLVQSTIHTAKQNGEQLLNILNNHDIEASIAQAVKLLEPLARDGVTVNDSYTVGGSLQNQLPSKGYYQLWLSVTAELDKFEQYLVDLTDPILTKTLIENLYERVQYHEQILQRLYLMIVVGSWLVRAKIKTFYEIFEDLIEMSSAIQSSQRGLFLRSYILQKISYFIKNVEDYSNTSTEQFVEVILTNFREMNKLWVRMQFQGRLRDFDKRKQERSHIRMLIGKNLVYLSNLGETRLSQEIYNNQVLPVLLSQAIASRDIVTQDYLFECIVQVYNDEFHLNSQPIYMAELAKVVPGVAVNSILSGFIERIQEQSIINYERDRKTEDEEVSEEGRESREENCLQLLQKV
jgi:vacuolar protein sorting-associated protein 35